jgi:hypothetical protein
LIPRLFKIGAKLPLFFGFVFLGKRKICKDGWEKCPEALFVEIKNRVLEEVKLDSEGNRLVHHTDLFRNI